MFCCLTCGEVHDEDGWEILLGSVFLDCVLVVDVMTWHWNTCCVGRSCCVATCGCSVLLCAFQMCNII